MDPVEQRRISEMRPSLRIAVLADSLQPRAQQVRAILWSRGLRSIRPRSRRSADWPPILAVVACDPVAPYFPEALRLTQELTAGGVPVISYGDGAARWSLGVRCQVLLAGARHLLDAGAPDFLPSLARVAEQLLAAEAEQLSQRESLKSLFADLGVIGASPAMLAVFRAVVRVSRLSDLPTLLLGETGTGKELLARAVHRLDRKRAHAPFVPVNCSAVPEALAESEFFGFRSGAFTGALRDRKGHFRAAQGGVLFLDEVGELGLSLQGKLLRVLQEGRVLGLGEDTEVPVDVRVIGATNHDLEALVRDGRFREDLFHRLGVVCLRIPPLRERPEDLRPLVEHFLSLYSGVTPGKAEGVMPEVIEALGRLELSGNARQLENLVRQALLRKEDIGPLALADLPPEVWKSLARDLPSRASGAELVPAHCALAPPPKGLPEIQPWVARGESSLAYSLLQFERRLLEQALETAHGNQTQAAHILGITPRSVYNKLRKHGLL